MSQRPNPLAIGTFFALALVLMAATLFFFGASDLLRKKERFVLFFEGSITGLKTGAPVTFQGVQVGQVADIGLKLDAGSSDIAIPVYIDIDRDRFQAFADNTDGLREQLIGRGLRAQLKIQSLLTSLLYIELDFSPEYPVRYVATHDDYPELPTIPTPFQELTKDLNELNLEQLVQKVQKAVDGVESLVNSPDARGAVEALHRLLNHADEAVVHLDRQLVPAIADLRAASQGIVSVTSRIEQSTPAVEAELQATLQAARGSLARIDAAIAQAGFVFSEDSALYQGLLGAARDVSDAARSVERTSDTLDRQPEALLRGKQSPTAEK